MNDKEQIKKIIDENSRLEDDIDALASTASDLITEIAYIRAHQNSPNSSFNTNSQINSSNLDFSNLQGIKSKLTQLFSSFNEKTQKKIEILRQKNESEMKEQLIKYHQLEDQLKVQQETILKQKEKEEKIIKSRNDLLKQNQELITKIKISSEENEKIRNKKEKYKKEIEKRDQIIKSHNDSIEKVSTQYEELIENLTTEKQQLVDKIKSLQNPNSSENQNSMQSSPSKASYYSQKLKKLSENSPKEVKMPSKSEEEIDRLKNELQTLNKNNSKLSKEVEFYKSELNKSNQEKKIFDQKLTQLKSKNQQLKTVINSIEAEKQTIKLNIQTITIENDDKIKEMKSKFNETIKKLEKSQKEETENQIIEHEKTENELKGQLEDTKIQLNGFKEIENYIIERNQILEDEIKKKKTYIEEILQEKENINSKLETITSKLATKNETILKLKNLIIEQNDSIQQFPKKLEKMKQNHEKELQGINNSLDKSLGENKTLTKKIEENEKIISQLKEKNDQNLKNFQKAKKELKLSYEENQQISDSNKALQKELTELNDKYSKIEKDFSIAKKQIENNQEKFNSEKEELTKEIAKLKKKNKLIQKENKKLKTKNNNNHNHFESTDYLIDLNDFQPIPQQTDNETNSTIQKVVNKKTSDVCIIKTINENNNDETNSEDLVKMLTQFQHPTIIDFQGYSTQDLSGKENISIIMEYAQKGSLQDILRHIQIGQIPQGFTNTSRQIILIGVARSMMIFSKHKMFLGNLKPSNILLDEYYYPHLTDFYETKLNNNQPSESLYLDPKSLNEINKKSDIYSFALIMYEIVTGSSLVNQDQPYTKMVKENRRPKIPDNINSSLKELIEKCWSANLSERPSFEEVFYQLAYNKNCRLEDVDENEVEEYMKMIKSDLIICNKCEQPIDKTELVYYSGFPYHESCVECQICKKSLKSNQNGKIEDFVCLTPGFFLCQQHYIDYNDKKDVSQEFSNQCKEQMMKNITKELVDFPIFKEDNITEYQPNDIFIDSWMIDNSFSSNNQSNLLFPSVTFHFSKPVSEIDLEKLKNIFGDNIIITDIKKGSCLVMAAIVMSNEISTQTFKEYEGIVSSLKKKLEDAIGKSIVGNLVDKPKIKNADESKINEFINKKYTNVLQNAQPLDKIKIKEIKDAVFNQIHDEITFQNLEFIFKQNELFNEAEKQIRHDIENNPYELVITAHTVIANKYFNEYNEIKSKIPKKSIEEVFLYHGSRLANHCKIVKKHFLMPGKDDMSKVESTDEGFYGKGIYATNNIFYATYFYNDKILNHNERASVFCCRAIYNKDYVNELNDLSQYSKPISDNISSNFGINHALVGDVEDFWPIKESEKDKNDIVAEEFVFPTKYQIIPICSFILMRTDYYILWKDDHIENDENRTYMEDLEKRIGVNVYFKKNMDEALELVKTKKKNKIKLITNGGEGLTGKKLIEECRKIVNSNFVCLVFANDKNHLNWVTEMENVLFTLNPEYFQKFAAIDMEKDAIIKFANELEKENSTKFKINEDSLLNFPLFNNIIHD